MPDVDDVHEEGEMIEPELARKFLEQVTNYTEYNINIMDESGVIIASRDADRIGTYHEVADRIIRGPQEVIVIRDDKAYPGVLPGINMAIILDGRKEGVVGVTGNPDQIHDVALITRMAMETMLKYEKQQEAIRLRRSRKEHFLSLLTQAEFADSAEIRGIARQLEYDEKLVRVSVLVKIRKPKRSGQDGEQDGKRRKHQISESAGLPKPEDVLEALRHGRGLGRQDFSFVMDETHLLVFKTVKIDGRRNFTDYREDLREDLNYMQKWLRPRDAEAIIYVGSLQDAFTQYFYSYRHAKWLESYVNKAEGILFFVDYVKEYFRTLMPRQELQRIFNIYGKEMAKDTKEQFVEMTRALEATNYNLSETARKLFVHKNTLVYRYNKIKELLGIDPLESPDDRAFMEMLYLFLAK